MNAPKSFGTTRAGRPRGGSRARLYPLLIATVLAVTGIADAAVWSPPVPNRSLWQLDLLYLDEPAPLADELSLGPGVTLLVVCEACAVPEIDPSLATVRTSADPAVARAYGLLSTSGQIGPGYAIIAGGRVRYRTFDPEPAAHRQEIEILLRAVR